MERTYYTAVNKISKDGYLFQLGRYISLGWKLGIDRCGIMLGFGLASMFMTSAISVIPFVGSLASQIVVWPCLNAGVYYYLHQSYRKRNPEFGDFFKGFDKLGHMAVANLIKAMIVALILVLAAVVFGIGLFDAVRSADDPLVLLDAFQNFLLANFARILGVGITAGFLLAILSVMFLFVPHFVMFGNMSGLDAVKSSMAVVKKKLISFLIFMFVLSMINVAGFCCFVFGLIITIPVTYASIYFAFHEIVMKEVDLDSGIGQSEDILDS